MRTMGDVQIEPYPQADEDRIALVRYFLRLLFKLIPDDRARQIILTAWILEHGWQWGGSSFRCERGAFIRTAILVIFDDESRSWLPWQPER